MIQSIQLGDSLIAPNQPPYVIAEMSGNHNRSLDRALAIVDAAAASGAHAVKLQTYTADTMTLDIRSAHFTINDLSSPWHGRTLYELYDEAHTPWEWHAPIMERARSHGLECFSSPFDESAVDFLETLDVPAYKIASFEVSDTPLVRRAARTGKPIIMSTGMASLSEIAEAVDAVSSEGNQQLILLKCTSTYPAPPEQTNLLTVPVLHDTFGLHVGLSDHTLGIGVAVASVALGASVIEKHLTLSRADGGVDAAFSLEPVEFKSLVDESHRAWQALGAVHFGSTKSEGASRQFRRSLYVAKPVKVGDRLTRENVRSIRPGYGLPPKYLELVLGMKVTSDAGPGTPLTWDLLE